MKLPTQEPARKSVKESSALGSLQWPGEGVAGGVPLALGLLLEELLRDAVLERERVREALQSVEGVALAVREEVTSRVRERVRVAERVARGESDTEAELEAVLLLLSEELGLLDAVLEALAPLLSVLLLLAVEEGEAVSLAGGGSHCQETEKGVPAGTSA